MDKVIINKLRIQTIIGIHEWERETLQDILVTVIVSIADRPINTPDNISGCLDYSDLVDKIRTLVETARRFTVEALAEDIARICLVHPLAHKVIVRVEKPQAIPQAESVGVEIERNKA